MSKIEGIQKWLEEDIIARGICPPLVKLANGFRGEDKKIDWARLSEEVVIEDATHFAPDSHELLSYVSRRYLDFIHHAVEGRAPLTHNIILPDFNVNEDLDILLKEVKENAFSAFTSTHAGREFAASAFLEVGSKHKTQESILYAVILAGAGSIAVELIEGAFNTINFYGRRVTNSDVSGFSGERGQ